MAVGKTVCFTVGFPGAVPLAMMHKAVGHVFLANGHTHHSLGQRPRNESREVDFWPTAIFNPRASWGGGYGRCSNGTEVVMAPIPLTISLISFYI